MFKDIVLHSPDFLIKCDNLIFNTNVYDKMRENGISRSYVYVIARNNPKSLLNYDFLKVGKSSPNPGENREVQIGERIARQISHVPGWVYFTGTDPISSHGQDFMNAVNYEIKNGNIESGFCKNDITIGVWDISKRMYMTDMLETIESEIHATSWAEGSLAVQYKNLYGRLPLLNYVDPSNSKFYRGGYIPRDVGKLFGW